MNRTQIISNSMALRLVATLACSTTTLASTTGDPLGACCHQDPVHGYICSQETMSDCHALPGGVWYGAGAGCFDPGVECEPIGWGDCQVAAGMDCAGRPAYTDTAFSQVFGDGQVAVQTAAPSIFGGFVVTVFDLSDVDAAPVDSWWSLDRYSDPDWTRDKLGSVYGLAVNEDGDIFVTATRTWNTDEMGVGGWGAVYRLDHVTGDISIFATLPNNGCGLGNITWNCVHNSFYVTNFEDGLIYQLDDTGAVVSTFDPAAPWTGAVGPVALGDRPFAVEAHNGRLFYSMWNESTFNGNATVSNEIWSVALDGFGTPYGSEELEVTLPALGTHDWSAPVGDMRFSPTGTMLLAERSNYTYNSLSAHSSRVLEYECDGYGWVPSSTTYGIGEFMDEANATGGVDVDIKRTWAGADAMHLSHPAPYTNIYGFQGLPVAGGTVANSVLVDYQDNMNITDKTMLGDLVVTTYVEVPCIETHFSSINCRFAPGIGVHHEINFGFSNMGPLDITQVSLALPSGVTATPSTFTGPFAPYQSYPLATKLYGANPGSLCIDVVITRADGTSCSEELCFPVPYCDAEPGDINADYTVDILDLLLIIDAWGQYCDADSDCRIDQDGDGVVGIGDLLVVLENWSD